jgi:hypothetical protein
MISYLIYKFSQHSNSNYLAFFFYLNFLTLFQLPLYFYASTFNRLSRNTYLIQYSLISQFNFRKVGYSKFLQTIILIIVLIVPGYYIFLDFYFESVIMDILNNNLFISFFG